MSINRFHAARETLQNIGGCFKREHHLKMLFFKIFALTFGNLCQGGFLVFAVSAAYANEVGGSRHA